MVVKGAHLSSEPPLYYDWKYIINMRLVPWQLWTIMPAVRLCETVVLQLLSLGVN